MGKRIVSVLIGLVFILTGASVSLAHHSGGVEVGDLETGSVTGQPFKELTVDASFQAIELAGGPKVWYPPVAIINLKDRTAAPVVLKVTNASQAEHGFSLSADASYSAPTSLNVKVVLKPGETKYIGIQTSDLTYVTAGGVLRYKCHLHEPHVGGQLMILK